MTPAGAEREWFETLLESQYWTREKLIAAQRRRLERLLRHARANVPFYRDRLEPLFDGNDAVSWERWDSVPLLTREDLLDDPGATRSTSLPAAHRSLTKSTTSGSTGRPLTVWSTSLANAVTTAALHRAQGWHGLDWSRDLLFWTEERPDSGVWPNVEVGQPWGPPGPRSTGRRLRFNGDTPAADVLDFIRNNPGVAYLSCRAKVAQVLALESERIGRPATLDAVFAFSTATLPDEREDIGRAFGAKVLSLYSSKEAHLMAYQCPTGEHLHINEELVLVELLNDAGRPVETGQTGRVVVTNLHNWAQPIIRYVQGDLAVEGEPCSCGRTLRVLAKVVGRVTDMFRFPDGRAVAFALPENTKQELGIKTWQVAQTGPWQLEVRYTPISDRSVDEGAVALAVRQRTHPEVAISFRRTDAFLAGDGRKFAEYVNEFERRSA